MYLGGSMWVYTQEWVYVLICICVSACIKTCVWTHMHPCVYVSLLAFQALWHTHILSPLSTFCHLTKQAGFVIDWWWLVWSPRNGISSLCMQHSACFAQFYPTQSLRTILCPYTEILQTLKIHSCLTLFQIKRINFMKHIIYNNIKHLCIIRKRKLG